MPSLIIVLSVFISFAFSLQLPLDFASSIKTVSNEDTKSTSKNNIFVGYKTIGSVYGIISNEKIENMASFLNDKSLQTLQGFDYDSVAASSEDEMGTDATDEEMFYQQDEKQNSKNYFSQSIKNLTKTLFNR